MDTIYLLKQFMTCMHVPGCVVEKSDQDNQVAPELRNNRQQYKTAYAAVGSIADISDKLLQDMLKTPCPAGAPLMRIEEDSIVLCKIERPDTDEIVLLGPVKIGDASASSTYSFLSKYEVESSRSIRIYSCKVEEYAPGILLLDHALAGRTLTWQELWGRNGIGESEAAKLADQHVGKVIFDRQEEKSPHNPYDEEVREMDSIRNGDIEGLEAAFQESYSGQVGTLSDDPVRQARNLAIVLTTLASRKAIEGGLNYEISFSMEDAYVQQVEKMNNPVEILQFSRNVEIAYAQQVAEVRKSQNTEVYNPLVNQAKNEIFRELHGKVNLKEIAEKLHVSHTYLSHLFTETEGITMQQYVTHQKVKLAENLLRYSDYSVLEISDYLGFCSSSHLGTVFAKETGMTPLKYRKKYQQWQETKS